MDCDRQSAIRDLHSERVTLDRRIAQSTQSYEPPLIRMHVMGIDLQRSQLNKPRLVRSASPAHLDAIGSLPTTIAPAPHQPGAQLHDVLALVQQRAPSATGLFVRNGVLYVAYR